MAEFRKITPKPMVAVIYTHFHPDHTTASKVWFPPKTSPGPRAIYAQESLMKNYITQGELIGPILGVRSSYRFGAGMSAEERQGMNYGLGPLYQTGATSFIPPTKTFGDQMDMTIAGVKLQLYPFA